MERMSFLPSALPSRVWLAALLLVSPAVSRAQTPAQGAPAPSAAGQSGPAVSKSYPWALVQSGSSLFQQNCSFCHGRDAGGGESGPDLTRSQLVTEDVDGDKIGAMVRNGRPEKGMPRFDFSDQQIAGLTAFIHTQQNNALTKKGDRKGVDVSDLQTGNVEAGKQYFNGAGRMRNLPLADGRSCRHRIALPGPQARGADAVSRGREIQSQVTLASGQTLAGTLAYLDEFTVGLIDPTGVYRSWRTGDVKYKIDAPVNAHVDLFGRYTDADIHNLMAYLQTLR